MSLTYQDNDTPPIAKVDDKFVYIDEKPATHDKIDIMNKIWDIDTINIIAEVLNEMSLKQVIDILSSTEGKKGGMMEIEGKDVQVIPSPMCERLIIGGTSGSGKSWFAANYAKMWQTLFPEKNVYLFARQEDDTAFDGIELEEIIASPNLLEETLDINTFEDSLVIFDDMDNLQDKKVLDYIHLLLGDLMACGRKKNIYVMYITHKFKNNLKTKVALNESNKIVFFNGTGDKNNIDVLKDYACMKSDEIKRMITLPGRWACLERNRPRYVVYEKGVVLL